jgi:hypothetical protein
MLIERAYMRGCQKRAPFSVFAQDFSLRLEIDERAREIRR